jgi:DNA-binding XRE family transcriptional regulator
VIRPNGRIRWISNRIGLLLDRDRQPVHSVCIAFDITKRHEELQSLSTATAHYQAMVEVIPGAVWIVDKNANISRTLKIGGSRDVRLAGRQPIQWFDLVHADDMAEVRRLWDQAVLARIEQTIEHRISLDGERYGWARTTLVPVAPQVGRPPEWICASIDIDLEKRYVPSSNKPKRLTGAQIRAARGMLTLSVRDLAQTAGVSPTTIRRYEEADGPIAVTEDALVAIEKSFVEAGVEFLFPDLGKPGLRPK